MMDVKGPERRDMKMWLLMSVSFFILTLLVTVIAWFLGPASLTAGFRQQSPVSQEMTGSTSAATQRAPSSK